MVTFTDRLKFYRTEAKLSQKELAEKVGISFAAYNKYETKGYEPKIEILVKLAYALNCSVNDLVGYIPPAKTPESMLADSDIQYIYNNGIYSLNYDANDKSKVIDIKEDFFMIALSKAWEEYNNKCVKIQHRLIKIFPDFLYNVLEEYLLLSLKTGKTICNADQISDFILFRHETKNNNKQK